MEIWKDIKDFNGKYKVSNLGNIKSLNYNNTGKEKILIPKVNKHNGLLEVTLNKGDKHYYKTIARLVLENFKGMNLSKNDIVMYKNGDKKNCSLNNLYVITRGKRQEITYDNEKRYRPKYDYYGEILSTKEIAKRNNINSKTIRRRIIGLYWNVYEASEIPVAIYRKEKK